MSTWPGAGTGIGTSSSLRLSGPPASRRTMAGMGAPIIGPLVHLLYGPLVQLSSPQGNIVPQIRADAARNRRAIMTATEELLAQYEPGEVSIERIAAAAGVGKATVFHRFGSRAELLQAVAHERTESLRIAIMDGPP